MGKVLMCGTSGGVTSDDVTAKRADVLAGKKTITADSNDEIVEGTFPNRGHYMATPTNAVGSAQDGGLAGMALYMEQGAYYEKPNGDSIEKPFVVAKWDKVRGAVGATDPAKWRSNATIAGRAGTMPEQGGSTIVPGTSNKTAVAANRYVNGNVIVSGDPNLVAGNIKKGARIFGVTGIHEGYVTSPLNLFNNGTWGGGVSGFTVLHDTSNVRVESGLLKMDIGRKNSIIRRTTNLRLNSAVNFDAYRYLKVDVNFYRATSIDDDLYLVGISSNPGLTLSGSEPLNTVGGISAYSSVTAKGTVIIDIGRFSGNHFIYLESWKSHTNGTEISVSRIYLTNN